MRRIRLVSGLFVIVLACSGKTSSNVSVNDGGVTPPGPPAPNAPDCPASEPAQDSACTKDGLLCEYGNDFNPLCNSVDVCSGTRWAHPIFGGGQSACPSKPLPTATPNPSDCAATRATVPEGTACTSTSTCAYDGATCKCGSFCPSYPVGERPCDPDAGITTNCCDTSKITWYCFDGPPYCPTPRPRIGSACSKDGDQCAVEPAMECGQAVIRCEKGVWTVPINSCPVSTARAKKDIAYLSPADEDRLRDDVMRVKLATYRYKSGDESSHLGFIIEDMPPGSPAVLSSRERVDLYGYTSMTVAAVQRQEAKIEMLERRIGDLEKRCAK